jgi:short-subunit dehydrogenase
LVARDGRKLKALTEDLKVRGAAKAVPFVMDANQFERHGAMLAAADKALGGLDLAFIAHGTLCDEAVCRRDYKAMEREFKTNFLSVVSILTPLANRFEKEGRGTLAVISSVAGDRGRQSNYVYGTAKAGLSAFLQGLRGRLAPAGVRVITFKPGFVDTPMTAHLKKGLLFASAESTAKIMVRAMDRGADVVYVPWFWRWIMLVIKLIPERVFKNLKL